MPLIALLGAVWLTNAEAIPAFARKHQAKCSTCHSSWPALNAVGRAFKENGYRFQRNEDPGFMGWDQTVPVSAMIKARPYEEKDGSGNRTQRALHEVEVMVAGSMAKDFSGFFELESEDDAGSFNTSVHAATIGWHPSEAANVQVSWASIGWTDPYDTYSDTRKLTRNRPPVIDQAFGKADNGKRLRDARQNIAVYGRPLPQLFYSVGISGVAKDDVGNDANVVNGRLAFDVMPNLMLGLSAMNGTCSVNAPCTVDRDFNRVGLDFQGTFAGAEVLGSYLKAKDDNVSQVEESNDAWYLEGRYVVSQDGRPTWVPLLRYGSYEKNDGQDSYDELVAAVSYYVTENAKAFLEYQDLSGPTSADDSARVTLQFEIAL